jgi:hypothetical protein
VYWGNPYAPANSNDDSNHSDDVPIAVDVRAAAIDVCAFVIDVRTVVADMSTASVGVSTAAVDLCPSDAALADVSTAFVDASIYFVDTSAVSVDVSTNGIVANINTVPAAPNHATSPYDNIMSASRRESTGWSVEPSNVTGIDNQHEMWIQQVMIDDWEIQSPHEFQSRAIHHVAFHCNQIVYIVAKTSSGKSAIPLSIGSLQTGVTLSMVPLVGLLQLQTNRWQKEFRITS